MTLTVQHNRCFLAHLYGCTGKAISLPPRSMLVALVKSLILTASASAVVLAKHSFKLKFFLCDRQGLVRQATLYGDRSCFNIEIGLVRID